MGRCVAQLSRWCAVILAVMLTASLVAPIAGARSGGGSARGTKHGKPRSKRPAEPKRPAKPKPAGLPVEVILSRTGQVGLKPQATRYLSRIPASASRVIDVNDAQRYQHVVGFGAAMTDSSAWLLHYGLSPGAGSAVMSRLFGASGIGLDALRIPIGASDFSAGGTPYTYDDVPPGQTDPLLAQFSTGHDDTYVIPMLQEALSLNPRIWTLASIWSPPAWMKTNGSLANVNDTGGLARSAYGALAQYLVRFVQSYTADGIPIDALTPQNEPSNVTQYPGMNLSASEETTLLRYYLLPALRGAGLRTAVFGYDWNWTSTTLAGVFWGVTQLMSDPVLAGSIGVAWHCYTGAPTVMSQLQALLPNVDQAVTECSSGIAPGPSGEMIVASLRNDATSVMLWNLALDSAHGPVQQPNSGCGPCYGLVTIDPSTRQVHYNRDYYELGQASRYVMPGAQRIGTNTFVSYRNTDLFRAGNYATADIDDVALINPDGGHVLLVYNNAGRPERIAVSWQGRSFSYQMPGLSMATFTWNPAHAAATR